MQKMIYRSALLSVILVAVALVTTSCQEFIFGKIVINHEEDPRIVVEVPTTKADIYFKEPPVVTTPNLKNPDPEGAFADWATCLVMIKEGHSHGGGKMHGNYVYQKSPWQQEEFLVIRNTPEGPVVEVDKKSTATFLEEQRGIEGPNYLRVIAGPKIRWGLCFYFYDKEGKLINDKILGQSANYQMFFSISDLDDKGQPYQIMNSRWLGTDSDKGKMLNAKKDDWVKKKDPKTWSVAYPQQDPFPSEYFKGKMDFKTLQGETEKLFRYQYRDTWTHRAMNDGARDFFNIKLLPPLTRNDYGKAEKFDVDCVGLKGHLNFDFKDLLSGLEETDWPENMTQSGRRFTRKVFLLPQFFLAVRVMKKTDGNKLVEIVPEDSYKEWMTIARPGNPLMQCAPYMGPSDETGWEELMRFNLPIKVFCNLYDSDPTAYDPYEPYYWQMAMEIKLTPQDVFEAANSRIIHSDDGMGGEGFGQWFL